MNEALYEKENDGYTFLSKHIFYLHFSSYFESVNTQKGIYISNGIFSLWIVRKSLKIKGQRPTYKSEAPCCERESV